VNFERNCDCFDLDYIYSHTFRPITNTSMGSRDGSKSVPFPDPLLQSPSISYTDVLLTLAKISQHEVKLVSEESCVSEASFGGPSISRQPVMTGCPSKPRNPLVSTLAKLLSSTSGANGISKLDVVNSPGKDTSINIAQRDDVTESEALSLTSILSSSKVCYTYT